MAKRKYTTVAERKAILKELGVTAADMERFWNENMEINFKIRMLANNGHDWTDLTSWQMKELPNLKEKTLVQLAAKELAEKEKEKAKKEIADKKAYYEEHFEELMIEKIENHAKLTEEEISRLVFEYEISKTVGENRRWSHTNTSIVSLLNRYFSIVWEEGLTENQDNSYDEQPIEVKKHEYEKTIIVTEWLPI